MNTIKRFFLVVVALLVSTMTLDVFAVPAQPLLHLLTQPDGEQIIAMQSGDETQHVWENETGHTIVVDPVTNVCGVMLYWDQMGLSPVPEYA